MALGQTVTVVNKSGKVVSTGKHLVNVFNEAKSAYRERKAELAAVRNVEQSERQARKAIEKLSLEDDDNVSRGSSRRSKKSSRSSRSHRDKPPMERGYTDSFYANDDPRPSRSSRPSGLRNEFYMDDGTNQRNELIRRHSEAVVVRNPERPKTSRSASLNDVDMDLAYGELPPPLPLRRHDDEVELRSKMTKLQGLLDEANCMQHSVIAMIENLQKNPDALAAVALTLGEISNIASKMAPGMLTAMKGSFPAIIALLASPEFLIAAGVGVGVTVIMLGGYKIIKKIKQRKEDKLLLEEGDAVASQAESSSLSEAEFDQLREIDKDLSRIEMWRRGIADAEESALGTSVEGEFITPGANKYLVGEGVIPAEQADFMSSSGKSKKSSGRSKTDKKASSKEKASKKRKKEPSGLRMLFKTRT